MLTHTCSPPDTSTPHLSDDSLLKMLAAPLRDSEVADSNWEEHLSGCSICRERLDRLAGVAGAIELADRADGLAKSDEVVARLIAESVTWLTGFTGGRPTLSKLNADDIRQLLGGEGKAELGELGGLSVLGLIGQGGMAVVLKGHDSALDREVAIKLLHPAYRNMESVRDRFRNEARAVAALTHENVVPIHQVAEQNGFLYFVMPLADGSLSDWLKSQCPPSVEERMGIALAVARGLKVAHEAGIIHRDLKPANLLYYSTRQDGTGRCLWLADFGLARRKAEIARAAQGDGTPGYMAPEIDHKNGGDELSDLYSLGVLLDALFPEGSEDRPTALIKRLKARDPGDRPASAAVVVSELEERAALMLDLSAAAQLKRKLLRFAFLFATLVGLPVAAMVGSDLLAGTNWVNRTLGAIKGGTVFSINGRFGVSRGLRLVLSDARDGDVIEVIGDGPVEVAPLILKDRTITLRARRSENQDRPVLKLAPDSVDSLIWVDGGTLTIEGLELIQEVGLSSRRPGSGLSPLIRIGGGNLSIVDSKIKRTGTSPDNPAYLVLSRSEAPVIRIINSEMEDPNGVCVVRSSFSPAVHEKIEIVGSKFSGSRWILVDPPSKNLSSNFDGVPAIYFDIRDSWAKVGTAIAMGSDAVPGRLAVQVTMRNCRVETTGPMVICDLGSEAEVKKVIKFADWGSVFSSAQGSVIAGGGSKVKGGHAEDGQGFEDQWRSFFGGENFNGTLWIADPLILGESIEDWRLIDRTE